MVKVKDVAAYVFVLLGIMWGTLGLIFVWKYIGEFSGIDEFAILVQTTVISFVCGLIALAIGKWG